MPTGGLLHLLVSGCGDKALTWRGSRVRNTVTNQRTQKPRLTSGLYTNLRVQKGEFLSGFYTNLYKDYQGAC